MWKCPKCSADNQGNFCVRCGTKKPAASQNVPPQQSPQTVQNAQRPVVPPTANTQKPKKDGGKIAIIILSIALAMVLFIGTIFGVFYFLQSRDTESDDSGDMTVISEVTPKPEKTEKPTETPTEEPTELPMASKDALTSVIGNYLESYVLAMNTGDATYMLPYVIDSCPLYVTQKEYVETVVVYEELVSFSLYDPIEMESDSSCVVSVHEVYNIETADAPLTRHEQTATYRLLKDTDGKWKLYEFVGAVENHL